jgi:hypothetical protein
MNVLIESGSMTLEGKIDEIMTCLAAIPGDMRLQDYIRLNLH